MIFFKYYLILFCFLTSCDFNPDKHIVPGWTMDFLGPLVKADMNIQNINELNNLYASQSLSLAAFGIPNPGIPVIIPSIQPTSPGPYSLGLTNAFGSAILISGALSYKITNGLEINVNAGTNIVIKQGSNILLSNTTPDIAPLTGVYTSPVTMLTNTSINSNISLSIPNFSSQGSNGIPVAINSSRKLLLEIFLDNVRVKSIDLTGSNDFTVGDTSEFSIRGNNIPSQSVSGIFTTFFKNNVPLTFNLQVYFLDNTKTVVLDSLFDGPTVILAGSPSSPEIQLITNVNNTKINNLNNASFARIALSLGGHGIITIPDSLVMKMQIVGDLKIKLNK